MKPPICRKVRFRTELDAKIALADRRAPGRSANRGERRIYHCPRCKSWHLTSMEAAS